MMHEAKICFCFSAILLMSLPTATVAGEFTLSEIPEVPEAVVVTYDARDGNLSVDGNGVLISTIEIRLASFQLDPGQYDPDWCTGFQCGDDVITANKIFRLEPAGFPQGNIGPVFPPDLTAQFLLDDLQIAGSIKPLGRLVDAPGGGPYLHVVPEPTSRLMLMANAIALAIGWHRTPRPHWSNWTTRSLPA